MAYFLTVIRIRYILPIMKYILKQETKDEFVSRHVKSYPVMRYVNNNLPDRTILLSVVFSSILVYVIAVYSIRGYGVTDINSKTFVGYKEAEHS